MLKPSSDLYLTLQGAANKLKQVPDKNGAIAVLRQAIKTEFKDFPPHALESFSPEDLELMESLLLELIDEIDAMRFRQTLHPIQTDLRLKLLFLKGVANMPLMPFKDPESEVYMPLSTLKGYILDAKLRQLLWRVQNAKKFKKVA